MGGPAEGRLTGLRTGREQRRRRGQVAVVHCPLLELWERAVLTSGPLDSNWGPLGTTQFALERALQPDADDRDSNCESGLCQARVQPGLCQTPVPPGGIRLLPRQNPVLPGQGLGLVTERTRFVGPKCNGRRQCHQAARLLASMGVRKSIGLVFFLLKLSSRTYPSDGLLRSPDARFVKEHLSLLPELCLPT